MGTTCCRYMRCRDAEDDRGGGSMKKASPADDGGTPISSKAFAGPVVTDMPHSVPHATAKVEKSPPVPTLANLNALGLGSAVHSSLLNLPDKPKSKKKAKSLRKTPKRRTTHGDKARPPLSQKPVALSPPLPIKSKKKVSSTDSPDGDRFSPSDNEPGIFE